MSLRFLGYTILLTFWPLVIYSQGLYFVEEYDPETYGDFRQNWSISQNNTGYMFFGNSAGLVTYNGVKWKSKHAPNGEIVRSLLNKKNEIYWGGRSDFGKITTDSLGGFRFKSYKTKIDSIHHNFGDIWRIRKQDDDVYFYSREAIFQLSNSDIEVYEFDSTIEGLFNVENLLLTKTEEELVYVDDSGGLTEIATPEWLKNDQLYVVLPFKGQHLFISRENGFFLFDGRKFRPFKTEVADYVHEHDIYRGTYINDKQIALATLSGGIVIMNTDGSFHSILTEEDGLPTNIIYGIYLNREGILWVATDNGLAKVLVNNPVTKLDDRNGFGGIPTFIESVDSTTYFGTTEGLFFSNSLGKVSKISSITNRTFDGLKIDDEIISSTPDGLFRIEDDKQAELISSASYRSLVPLPSDQNTLYGASLESIYEIKIDGNKVNEKKITSTPGYVHDLYFENNELWIVTAEAGVFRYDLYESLIEKYEIPISEGDIYQRIDYLGNKLRLGTKAGLFVHNPRLDSFIVDTTFRHSELSGMQVNQFRQCREDEIWFRNNRKIKRAVFESDKWEIEEDPYRLIDEGKTITTIHCGKGDDVWFGGTEGIYHLSNPEWEYDYDFNTNVTSLLVHNDSLIYGGYGDPDKPIELAYEDNQLRFTYAAASYVAPEQNMYKVRLRGYDSGWSNWTSETEKDYTFIPEGTYTFEVQGRNVYHKTGTIDSLTFTILPPWYRTWWAYGLYLLMIGGALYGAHQLRINRILREQRIRNRIASDLHDEVSATLSSITYFAQAIRQSKNGGKSERFVGLISESASDAKEKITDIIWSIDPDNDDWVNLLSKCRRFASDLFESKDMDYDLDIDTDINRPLDIELRQHLWLIYKEMVVNAARHSGARKVDINFGMQENRLRLVVQDNGKGTGEEAELQSGHGIKNIKKRANKIGAELRLETDSDIGTRWIMTLKMR